MTWTLEMKWSTQSPEKVPNLVLRISVKCQREPWLQRSVQESIMTKSNIGFKRNVFFRYLIVILEFLFCWLIYDFAIFIHIRLFWGSEIAMAFLLYFRTYCMIKEFFKEKWLGQWELWTPTKMSTQALFKLAEMVSRALAKLGDNFTVIFTYRNNLNYIGFFFSLLQ